MYPDNTEFTWNIRVNERNYILLTFTDFHVESTLPECQQDYVEVFSVRRDGYRGLVGRYCEAGPPPPELLSGMNEMTVVFSSDKKYSNSGFFGQYSSQRYTLPQHIREKIKTTGKNKVDYIMLFT